MNFKEIQELLKLINKLELTEFKMKDGEFELSVRTKNYEKGSKQPPALVSPPQQQVIPMPSVQQPFVPPATTPAAPAPEPAKTENKPAPSPPKEDNKNYLEIKSPIVGTFYRSSSPDKPPYIKVGDAVEQGQVVCIVEAMKLFNEIESEISGKIVKVMVEDAQPVEYDQVLFLVDSNG
jgi:acetyl-CoA carboxylase biotin carboxyl carrier protein